MRCTTLSLLLVLAALHAPTLQAQQWNGSTDSTGTIYRTGNVGIGISPSIRLHVVESAANTPVALFENTNSSFGSENLFTIKGVGGPTTGSSLFRILRGSTSIMHVRWDGNVGIGTPTPRTKLYVSNMGAAADAELTIDTENAYDSAIFLTEEGKTDIGFRLYYDSNDFKIDRYDIGPAVNALFIERTNGNMGIGTSTPMGKLDITGVDARYNPVTVRGTIPSIYLYDTEQLDGANRYASFVLETDSDRFFIGSRDKTISHTVGHGQRHFTVRSDGHVGIGTTTPEDELVVEATASPQIKVNATGSGEGATLVADSGGGDGGGALRLVYNSTEANTWTIFQRNQSPTHALAFNYGTNNMGYGSFTKFLIDTDGNVGIGTSSPNAKLEIKPSDGGDALRIDAGTGNNDTGYLKWSIGGIEQAGIRGFYDPNGPASSLAFYTGNSFTERLRIDATGKVGIGTTAPAYTLDVAGTLNADSILVNGQPLSATGAWATTNDDLHYMTGHVGIGTTTPLTKLSVHQDSHTSIANQNQYGFGLANQGATDLTIGSDASNAYIQSWHNKELHINNLGNDLILNATGGDVGIGTSSPSSLLHLANTNPQFRFEDTTAGNDWILENSNGRFGFVESGNATPKVVVAPGGKVGIGVTDPQVALDIAGTIHARNDASSNFYALQLRRGENSLAYPALFSETTNGTLILAGDTHGNGTVALGQKVGIGTTNPGAPLTVATSDPEGIRVLTTDEGGIAAKLRRDSAMGILELFDIDGATSGVALYPRSNSASYILSNLGIGTTNPTSELAVNGTITSKEVIVTEATEAWPDFVFDEGYELRSLNEVEQFIETKGHLPEVPSAEEVAANGVAMGAMQATLLQKIEELTLYLIDMKQEVDSLRAELDAVKKK